MPDIKVSALQESTTVSADDLVMVVDAPSGTPTSKRATIGAILNLLSVVLSAALSGRVAFVNSSGKLDTDSALVWDTSTQALSIGASSSIAAGGLHVSAGGLAVGAVSADPGANNAVVSGNFTAAKVSFTGNDLVFNSDAANTGADRSTTLRRPSTGQAANLIFTLPGVYGTSGHPLVGNGSGTLSFAQLTSVGIADNAVTDAKLRTSVAYSIIGRSAGTAGNVTDIAATVAGQVLQLTASGLGFDTIPTAGLKDGAVTLAKQANLSGPGKVIGRSSAGAGAPEEITLGVRLGQTPVVATCSTMATTTSTSFVDTGLTATITPANTGSRILVIANQNGLYKNQSHLNGDIRSVILCVNSAPVVTLAGYLGYLEDHPGGFASACCIYLSDVVGSLSPITFKVQFNSGTAGQEVAAQWGASSMITLIEILP